LYLSIVNSNDFCIVFRECERDVTNIVGADDLSMDGYEIALNTVQTSHIVYSQPFVLHAFDITCTQFINTLLVRYTIKSKLLILWEKLQTLFKLHSKSERTAKNSF
jgi:hypothetical protein